MAMLLSTLVLSSSCGPLLCAIFKSRSTSCMHCWFTCILPTTPPWLTCRPRSTSRLCNRVLRIMSALRACALQTVSHWFVCMLRTMSRRFTCACLMLRRGAPVGRNGDTWLPAEFLAPSSWRRRSSGRTGRKRPKQSEGVKKSREYPNTCVLK